jgi:hypothetical protein
MIYIIALIIATFLAYLGSLLAAIIAHRRGKAWGLKYLKFLAGNKS